MPLDEDLLGRAVKRNAQQRQITAGQHELALVMMQRQRAGTTTAIAAPVGRQQDKFRGFGSITFACRAVRRPRLVMALVIGQRNALLAIPEVEPNVCRL